MSTRNSIHAELIERKKETNIMYKMANKIPTVTNAEIDAEIARRNGGAGSAAVSPQYRRLLQNRLRSLWNGRGSSGPSKKNKPPPSTLSKRRRTRRRKY
jgi:hypothetical protein